MFGIMDANGMLAKAKRELKIYRNSPTPDNIFNLFVTIYHIEDYLIQGPRKHKKKRIHKKWTKDDIKTHFGNLYIVMQFICHKNKHLKLHDPRLQQIDSDAFPSTRSSLLNGSPLNATGVNAGTEFRIKYDKIDYELGGLANQLISKWEDIL